MKPQEAISILMLSPCYWRMKIPQRLELLKEYLASYAAVAGACTADVTSKKTGDNR